MTACTEPTGPDSEPLWCRDRDCLLFETFRVGLHHLRAKSVQDSLLGRVRDGRATFKLGSGKVKVGSVTAANALLEREYPQVVS